MKNETNNFVVEKCLNWKSMDIESLNVFLLLIWQQSYFLEVVQEFFFIVYSLEIDENCAFYDILKEFSQDYRYKSQFEEWNI